LFVKIKLARRIGKASIDMVMIRQNNNYTEPYFVLK